MASQQQQSDIRQKTRVHVYDVVRGFSVLSMVAFHLCYDLKFICGKPLEWFAPPLQDVWRASISWTFVFIAGCMFAYSRDNLRRSGRYLAVALLVFLVTTFAKVDVPINFGIIYCMGACTLTTWLLDIVGIRPRGPWQALAFFAVFVMLLHISRGRIGVGPLVFDLPRALYSTPWLAWLGLPGPGFASGDYYPLLPYLMLFLCGSAMGRSWRSEGMPEPISSLRFAPLEFVGRHALPIYVLHQPLLLLVLGAF